MSTLHIVNRSPWRSDALQRCLEMMVEQDALLLIEDGVLAVSYSALPEQCYVLSPDLAARGLQATDKQEVVDYDGFVELACRYDKSVSWS